MAFMLKDIHTKQKEKLLQLRLALCSSASPTPVVIMFTYSLSSLIGGKCYQIVMRSMLLFFLFFLAASRSFMIIFIHVSRIIKTLTFLSLFFFKYLKRFSMLHQNEKHIYILSQHHSLSFHIRRVSSSLVWVSVCVQYLHDIQQSYRHFYDFIRQCLT